MAETAASTFALIVAIDQYKTSNIRSLNGCVHDGTDFREFLIETRKVPADNIRTLFNAGATREAIIETFKSFLIKNTRINRGSLMFFYYAGHGDRVDAPHNWNSDEKKVETICPYDITAFANGNRRIGIDVESDAEFGIPDWTINALMRRLAHEKGNNIVAIFDCCHSGGVTRDLGAMTWRSLPEDETMFRRLELPADLDKELLDQLADPDSGSIRGLRLAPAGGFAHSGTTSHVLLAACQPQEKAGEYKPDGLDKTRGYFTYNLLAYLRRLSPSDETGLTYAGLVENMAQMLQPAAHASRGSGVSGGASAGKTHSQQPHCEGQHKNRILFRTREATRSNVFMLTYKPVSGAQYVLHVNAGAMHGVAKGASPDGGTCFTMSIPPTAGVSFGSLTLIPRKVEAHRCQVDVDPAIGCDTSTLVKSLCGPNATVTISAGKTALLRVKGLEALPRIEGFVLLQSMGSEYADVAVSPEGHNGEHVLKRYDPLMGTFAKQTKLAQSKISAPILTAIAGFNFHLYRHNDNDNDISSGQSLRRQLRIKVQLYRLQSRRDSGLRVTYEPAEGSQDLFAGAKTCAIAAANVESSYKFWQDEIKQVIIPVTALEEEKNFGLTLINESTPARDLFPYVFYFEPLDYSIFAWYLPPNPQGPAPLLKHGKLDIGHGAGAEDTLKLFMNNDVKVESGFLKIFVSNKYVDMSNLIQLSWGDSGTSRDGPRQPRIPMATMAPIAEAAGWSSSIYVLATT